MGVVNESGQAVTVQVRITGEDGELYLPLQNYYNSTTVCYGIAEVGLDQTFGKVEIYASEGLSIGELRWNSTDK